MRRNLTVPPLLFSIIGIIPRHIPGQDVPEYGR